METTQGNDRDSDDEAGAKLIPEWRVAADDQVILAGLGVFVIFLLALGWNLWRSDDADQDVVATEVTVSDIDGSLPPGAEVVAAPAIAVAGQEDESTATTTTTVEATTTSAASAGTEIGDVQLAVDPFPGAITGTNDGSAAVLEGFVANQAESDEAEAAALEVAGIEEVSNRLVILEPAVEQAIAGVGVINAEAAGVGTEMTLRGTIATEDDRQPSIDAALAVDGVTDVNDELVLSVTAELNELPQVQFATASAEILPASFEDLAAAAELLNSSDAASIQLEGYTDIQGDEAKNQTLSEDRANAVRDYLINNGGVDPATLSAVGFGETEQFAPGSSPEALAQNRLVRFVELG